MNTSMISKIRHQLDRWNSYKLSLKGDRVFVFHLVDWTETILVALVLALIIRKYVIQTSKVPTGSMIPTMMVGDRLFVNKFIYRFQDPRRGDIVVFKSPKKDGKDYVKRCVGLPGETIEIKKGIVYANGKQLIFPGIQILRDYDFRDPIVVPAHSFFMLGDNRAHSWDSRFWGFVPKEDVLGRAWFRFWPLPTMQVLR